VVITGLGAVSSVGIGAALFLPWLPGGGSPAVVRRQ
jgi:hypothetical protein